MSLLHGNPEEAQPFRPILVWDILRFGGLYDFNEMPHMGRGLQGPRGSANFLRFEQLSRVVTWPSQVMAN